MLTNFHIVANFVNIFITTKTETYITGLFENSFQEKLTTKKPVNRFALQINLLKVLKITKFTRRYF